MMNWRQWPWTMPTVEITKRSHIFKEGCSMKILMNERMSVVTCKCGHEVLHSIPPIGFREYSATAPSPTTVVESFSEALGVLREIQPDWSDECVNARIDEIADRLEAAHARELIRGGK